MNTIPVRAGLLAVAAAILVACGGGGGSSPTATATATSLSGVLTDGPVKGVCYLASPSGLKGTTSATGAYNFSAGDSVAFWIDTSGAGCGATAANNSSTTGISLGTVSPGTTATGTTEQTFILSLSTGSQAAETLQALNHGTTSNMDVSGITLPAANVQDINTYIASSGDNTGTASNVVNLFTAAQGAAKVASVTLVPNLPVTNTFQLTVVNNLSTTISSGLGTAPSNFSIPEGTLVFAINSGNVTATTYPANSVGPYSKARILYYGANGAGRRIVSGTMSTASTFSLAGTTGDNLLVVDQPLTYSVSGNTVSIAVQKSNKNGVRTNNVASSKTMTYFDGKAGFYTGQATTTNIANGYTESETFTGADVRLTALTNAMLAGKVVKIVAPDCTNGVATMTFSADGTTAVSDCGGTSTFTPMTDVPGVMVVTSPVSAQARNDGSILFVGLDGSSVAAGSALVFVTGNPGVTSTDYPAWGRLSIISVQ